MVFSAIVVLPHIFFPDDGPISSETCARLDEAARLLKSGVSGQIATSGWAGMVSKITIAEAMRDYLVSIGVPRWNITPETSSRDTVGDAVFTRRNLAPHWDSVLVVTSKYHVPRVEEVFGFVYGDFPIQVNGSPWPETEQLRANERKSVAVFRDTFQGIRDGDIDAIYARLRERHPFYNGKVFPAI